MSLVSLKTGVVLGAVVAGGALGWAVVDQPAQSPMASAASSATGTAGSNPFMDGGSSGTSQGEGGNAGLSKRDKRAAARMTALVTPELSRYDQLGLKPDASGEEIYSALQDERKARREERGLTDADRAAQMQERSKFKAQLDNLPKEQRKAIKKQCKQMRKEGKSFDDCAAAIPTMAMNTEPAASKRNGTTKEQRQQERRARRAN